MITFKPFWKQRKFQVAVTGILTIILSKYFHLDPELIGYITVLFSMVIAGIAYEDGKRLSK